MTKHAESLKLVKIEKRTGRVLAVNSWRTGAQTLVFADMAAFEAAKKLAESGEPVPVGGSTEWKE